MKKKIKWIVLAVIFIAIVGAALGGGNSDETDEKTTTQEESTSNISSDSSESKAGINEEKFNQIQSGMTYDEVKNIIGEDGQNISESEVAGIKTVMYQWEDDSWGVAIVTFQNDQVTNKSQAGISSNSVEVTLSQYDQVQTGMSYDEVKNIFGGDGQLTSETSISGTSSQLYQWNGKSLGSNCVITFSDSKVLSKSQFGLE